MKIGIIYDSITGNTKIIAEAIYEELNNDKNDVIIGNVTTNIEDCDLLFIGSWTDKGNCSKKITDFYKNISNKKIVIFGTAGFGGSKEYFHNLYERVKKEIPQSNEVYDEYFYCQGKMPLMVKDRYVKLLKEHPDDKNLEVSIKNFDEALEHPNKKDIIDVKEFAKSILNKEMKN